MDDMTRGYLMCALWTGMDESDESGGQPLDVTYSLDDFSEEAVITAKEDCDKFRTENADDLAGFPESPDGDSAEAFAGHNFWLTRNGHGTGFWDRGLGEAGDRLSESARKAGERYVYVGDDERLHIG